MKPLQIQTPRLVLMGATPHILAADMAGPDALAAALGVEISASWPPEHHDEGVIRWTMRTLAASPINTPWTLFYIVHDGVAVGTCGFTGVPDENHGVEIGYSVLPIHQRRGFASEAAAALVHHAFACGAREVAAETYPQLVASLRVMANCGMQPVAGGSEPGVVRWAISRE
jgi:RimJ/RimL family protein N-acetyltransferase